MAALRFYVDEDSMRAALVDALRARSVDVVTALEAGLLQRADEEHLEYAAREGRVLYSFNVRDFHRIHTAHLTTGKSHSGIVLARQQGYSVGEQMRRLLRMAAALSHDEMKDRLEYLSSWGE